MILLGMFTGLLIICMIIFLVIFVYGYSMHFFNSDFNSYKWDYANFKTFKKEFDKLIDYKDLYIRNTAICDGNSGTYLSYIVIRFNMNYMKFNPIEWLKYFAWHTNFIKNQKNKRIRGLWNEE